MTEAIKEYALAVTLFCIAAGICEIMIPDSNGSVGKYVRYVISLCVAAVILLPVGKAFAGNVSGTGAFGIQSPDVSQTESAKEAMIGIFRGELEKKASEDAEKNFSLGSGEVKVNVLLDTGGTESVRLISAYAYLSDNASGRSEEIEKYLEERLGCPVTTFSG
ncbi:MAG: hypothetical protein J5940_02750 [Clostridia bacterium]|nr:hypothetical protein [Clostridia bacterium]